MIRGFRIRGASNRHTLPHPAREFMRVLVLVMLDGQAAAFDPRTAQFLANPPVQSQALQPKGDVLQHGAVVEARVVLEDHAAIGARPDNLGAEHAYGSLCRRVLRREPRDELQDGALSATAGTEHAHELALVGNVLDREAHVANRRELAGPADVVCLGYIAELNHSRRFAGSLFGGEIDRASNAVPRRVVGRLSSLVGRFVHGESPPGLASAAATP